MEKRVLDLLYLTEKIRAKILKPLTIMDAETSEAKPYEEGEIVTLFVWQAEALKEKGYVEPIIDVSPETLIKFIYHEKSRTGLFELPENFFIKLKLFLKNHKDRDQRIKMAQYAEDLVSLRLQKITLIALKKADEETSKMTYEERILYNILKREIDDWRKGLLGAT